MERIFELYDEIVDEHISYHKSLSGALTAMATSVSLVAPALCRDYDEDEHIEFSLRYNIRTHKIKE